MKGGEEKRGEGDGVTQGREVVRSADLFREGTACDSQQPKAGDGEERGGEHSREAIQLEGPVRAIE